MPLYLRKFWVNKIASNRSSFIYFSYSLFKKKIKSILIIIFTIIKESILYAALRKGPYNIQFKNILFSKLWQ